MQLLCRLSSKDNPFRCSYILPDGITYKKGFVKDLDEARRYCSLPADRESDKKDNTDSDRSKFEDRKKPEISQNVTSQAILYAQCYLVPSNRVFTIQEFVLTNERLLVPEMLFHPIDLGQRHY